MLGRWVGEGAAPGAGLVLGTAEAAKALGWGKAELGSPCPTSCRPPAAPVPPVAVSRSVLEPRRVSHGSSGARHGGVCALGVLLRSSSGMNDIYSFLNKNSDFDYGLTYPTRLGRGAIPPLMSGPRSPVAGRTVCAGKADTT